MIKLSQELARKIRIKLILIWQSYFPAPNEDISLEIFGVQLREIDIKLPSTQQCDVPALFKTIPIDVFGELLLQTPEKYPNIRSYLPTMVSEETQTHWTGASGAELQKQSVAFIRAMDAGFTSITGKDLASCKVLDYGCGWGRLTRFLCKLVPVNNIYAVDPFNKAIAECVKHGVLGNLFLSDWVPKTLPVDQQFNLIFAFSVFSHLSEKTMHRVLETLHNHTLPNGVLVITIRPREYWKFHSDKSVTEDMEALHNRIGFAFVPHDIAPIDGDITYGDTSISLQYIEKRFNDWTITRIEYNRLDPLQIMLFLTPV